MNQWSVSRKRIVFLIVLVALLVLVGVPVYFFVYRAPTCFDGKFNGDETGVDCGGSCQLLCTAESLPLILKGDPQVLKIADDTFEVVVLIENPNTDGDIYKARYTFRLYDVLSTLPVKIVEGETYVPKNSSFAIFEGPFVIESGAEPSRATFEWSAASLVWRQNTLVAPEFRIKDQNLSRTDTRPRLDAQVENISLENIYNIDLVALISDKSGNIFAASKTFVDTLTVGQSVPVVFTWPWPFDKEAVDINIIPRILPDRSFIH